MADQARSVSTALIIPARMASTRFPGKPLVALHGVRRTAKTLIQRSWEAARNAESVDEIWIATDDWNIYRTAKDFGALVVMTSPECRNGTERCWDAVESAGIDAEIIVNFQGDAPLTPWTAVDALIETLLIDPSLAVATPMLYCGRNTLDHLLEDQSAGRVGGTTVVFDNFGDALYFSKRVLPYRPPTQAPPTYLHVGLYAYRREALHAYALDDPSPLESAEGLEQLRFLSERKRVRMVEISAPPGGLWEVNNPDDVDIVEKALRKRNLA